jgi:hypothetical protein
MDSGRSGSGAGGPTGGPPPRDVGVAFGGEGTGWLGTEVGTGELIEEVALPSPMGRVTTRLQADSARLVANWALRVANLPAFRATPDLNLTDLRDVMPEVLAAALSAMAGSDVELDPEPVARACDAAAGHGAARARAGFGIGALLEEYNQLRAVIWAAIWRMAQEQPDLAPALRDIQPRLSRTFGDVTIAAAEAWVNAQRGAGARP